jgi:hypothetical protein
VLRISNRTMVAAETRRSRCSKEVILQYYVKDVKCFCEKQIENDILRRID